ncbi:MAG: hypothetical protein M3169_10270 [Candidatus Eremiobacteraeota bacterium]|nr:hypothetical protein [Candidatus Eremiobacteraeota bacterium]
MLMVFGGFILCALAPARPRTFDGPTVVGTMIAVPVGRFVQIAAIAKGTGRGIINGSQIRQFRQRVTISQGPSLETAAVVHVFEANEQNVGFDDFVFVPTDPRTYFRFEQYCDDENFCPGGQGWYDWTSSQDSVDRSSGTKTTWSSDEATLTFLWDEPVQSLDLILNTPNEEHGEVSDDVWFDVGPRAWKINENVIDRNTRDLNIHLQPVPSGMTVDDMAWFRFEKKGINGWTGAPDKTSPSPFARDNRWHPLSFRLKVNGHNFGGLMAFPQNVILDKQSPSWRYDLKSLSHAEMFAYGLRDEIAPITGHLGEEISRFTTEFKKLGISGWQRGPLVNDPQFPRATAVGYVRHPPSPGDDGFVSLDLQLESVDIGGENFSVDGSGSVGLQRYVRVEYCHHANAWPRLDDHVQISGRVVWDTDKNGFFEIHPDGPADVKVIDASGELHDPQMMPSEIVDQSNECNGL